MAKRFTATDKWKDSWFSSLTKEQKLFWLYLLDECDNAGIWEKNFKVASFFLSQEITEEWAMTFLIGKAIPVNGTKWFIPKFVEFQYGELRTSNRAHVSVIDKLRKYGLMTDENKVLASPLQGAKDKDKEEDKDKVKEKEQDIPQRTVESFPAPAFNAAEFHQARMQRYPEIKAIQDKWNTFATKHSLAKIENMPNWRLQNILLRLKEEAFDFDKILQQIEKQPFLLGKSDKKWKVNFDWITDNEKHYIQIIEGVHIPDDGKPAPASRPPVNQSDIRKTHIAFFCECGHHSAELNKTDLEDNIGKYITCPSSVCRKRYSVKEILDKAGNTGRADFTPVEEVV